MFHDPVFAPHTPVYEALVIELKRSGVQAAFGLMSDDTALLISSLEDHGIEFCRARHENAAVAMAAGYAAATGRVGLAIIGRGPGTANALNGAMFALRSGAKVLLMLGAASTEAPADMKDFNAAAVLRAAGFRTFIASHLSMTLDALHDALASARAGDCATLLLPSNVLAAVPERWPESTRRGDPSEPLRVPPRQPAVLSCVELLKKCRRPLIVAGEGAWLAGARDEILALAAALGAVVGTTLKAKDMFRGHPYHVGVVGSFSHSAGRRMMDQADCLLAFGAGLNPRTTSHGSAFPAGIPTIQVDRDAARIGRWHAVDISIVADAKLTATALARALPARPDAEKPFHSESVRTVLSSFDPLQELPPAAGGALDPRRVAHALDRLLPARRNLVYDAGNFLQVQPLLGVPDPGCLRNTFDFASIGIGMGVAIGFAKGTPDRTTVLVVGDGGLLMTLGELESAAREVSNLIVVVMNDCAYGAELHYLKERGRSPASAVFADIEFADVAEVFGFEAHTIRTIDQLNALRERLAHVDGPMLLDCKISANYPAPFVVENAAAERRIV